MPNRAVLLQEIEALPPKYIDQVYNFVGYLRAKAQNETVDDISAYIAMAADTEREKEAQEWCNAYFGPK
jgi:hypothetical protein